MTASPLVSAIVPMFNREAMVADAIRSLLTQTLAEIEVVVVDDGSTDASIAVVEAIADRRIRLIRHPRNLGIPSARNTGLEAARGTYIAWLDSDDTARPERLAIQARFLDTNPDIAMTGACAAIHGSGRTKIRLPCFSGESIAPTLLFRSAFQQSAIMGRADILKAHPYRLDFGVAEDLEQFIRLSRGHRLANLPQVLVDRQNHAGQIVTQRVAELRERKSLLFRDGLSRLGISVDDANLDRHVDLGRMQGRALSRDMLEWSEAWLGRLIAANRRSRVYDPDGMAFALSRLWLFACRAARKGDDPGFAWQRLLLSPLSRGRANREGRRWLKQALAVGR